MRQPAGPGILAQGRPGGPHGSQGEKMDGANFRFMNGKSTWLGSHLIVYNVGRGTMGNPFNDAALAATTELPVHEFDLRKVGSIVTASGKAKEYELYAMTDFIGDKAREVKKRTRPIRAYFLPWGSGRTWCGCLGANADYFFTPTLNGCTFVHHGNGQSPSVGHSNFVNSGTQQIDQNAIDTDITQKFGFMPAHALVKTDYKRVPIAQEDYRATVIGIRSATGWDFYYQNYKTESKGGGKLTNTGLGLCVAI